MNDNEEKLLKGTYMPIHISNYASDEEKKQVEEIFSSFNPKVDKTVFTESIEQELLQIVVDITKIITPILLHGAIYDLLKAAIKNIYTKIKAKKPVLKLKYRNTLIFYVEEEDCFWIYVKDIKKANFRNNFYKSRSLKDVLELIKEEQDDKNA